MIFQTFFFCDPSSQLSPKGASWETKNSLEYHLRGPVSPGSMFPGEHYAKRESDRSLRVLWAAIEKMDNSHHLLLLSGNKDRMNIPPPTPLFTTDGPTMDSRRGPKKTLRSLPTRFMQITFFTANLLRCCGKRQGWDLMMRLLVLNSSSSVRV